MIDYAAIAAPVRAAQTSAPVPVPLSSVRVGSVVRFRGTQLEPESCDLLRALGLTRECQLTLCKAGEPCIVQVRSTRIGLSGKVAAGIFVVPDPQEG